MHCLIRCVADKFRNNQVNQAEVFQSQYNDKQQYQHPRSMSPYQGRFYENLSENPQIHQEAITVIQDRQRAQRRSPQKQLDQFQGQEQQQQFQYEQGRPPPYFQQQFHIEIPQQPPIQQYQQRKPKADQQASLDQSSESTQDRSPERQPRSFQPGEEQQSFVQMGFRAEQDPQPYWYQQPKTNDNHEHQDMRKFQPRLHSRHPGQQQPAVVRALVQERFEDRQSIQKQLSQPIIQQRSNQQNIHLGPEYMQDNAQVMKVPRKSSRRRQTHETRMDMQTTLERDFTEASLDPTIVRTQNSPSKRVPRGPPSQTPQADYKDDKFLNKKGWIADFKRQNISGYYFMPSSACIITCNTILGIWLLILGGIVLGISSTIIEKDIEYSSKCPLNRYCNFTVTITEQMDNPVFVYLKMGKFYQNHRE